MARVFLGGTASSSTWREQLIPHLTIEYFNPVIEDWNDAAMEREIYERKHCDYVLYVITPQMIGFYAIAELVDDSNKRPDQTLFCFIDENDEFSPHQLKSLNSVGRLIQGNGAMWLKDLNEVAAVLNK